MTSLARDPLDLDTDECDVCGHEGSEVELYDTRVQAGVRFDMPLCRKCARLGTKGDGNVEG